MPGVEVGDEKGRPDQINMQSSWIVPPMVSFERGNKGLHAMYREWASDYSFNQAGLNGGGRGPIYFIWHFFVVHRNRLSTQNAMHLF